MFNRQFSLLVIATLLLSPNLVNANEIDENPNLSIGNVQIQTTESGTTIQTPKIKITTPKATENRVIISRTRRRNLTQVRRGRTSTPAMIRQRVESNRQNTNPTAQIRNSTIRSSRNEDSSESIIEQQQSVQCSGSGSSVSQSSSTTVNGRTISSEVSKNCQ
ncbi:hypothetical protein [Chamaesiphon sp.]|uniref:hypothetical protein n=1 Tax=Chamaesiphon sp. TaxID=2814140 RepID=UPI003593CB7F